MQEISSLNQTLNDIKKNKKQSLGQLALVESKIRKRQELINNINKDLKSLMIIFILNQLEILPLK
jgi:hypothetical protein